MKKQREKLEEMRKWGTRNTEEKKKYRWERERKKMRKKKYRWKRARPKVDVEIEKSHFVHTCTHRQDKKFVRFISVWQKSVLYCCNTLSHTDTHTFHVTYKANTHLHKETRLKVRRKIKKER